MERHGWRLLLHSCLIEQLQRLRVATERAARADPEGFERNSNVKLFRAISRLVLDVIPSDPSRDEYRQGNTLGPNHRHWRRAKFAGRFRLFFRYDSNARLIVFAWVNDEWSLRSRGGRNDV